MSEHTDVRLPLLAELERLGWNKNQIQFQPEWKVPRTPSEASRREAGQSFQGFPVDIAIFDNASNLGNYENIQIIIETKAPLIDEGINQLKIYLSLEPHALLGIWSNGSSICLVYRTAEGGYHVVRNGSLPRPGESLVKSGPSKLKWNDLVEPTTAELKKTFTRLLNVVVAQDSRSTRRDDQLNNLCNVLLAKLEGDKIAKFNPQASVPFQVWDSESETAQKIRTLFQGMKIAHGDIFLNDTDNDIQLDNHTISLAVYELSKYKLRDASLNAVSQAFQVFRTASLKSAEGQYYTPYPVIRSVVKLMEIHPSDKVLDPACGTGGFLLESYRQLRESFPSMDDGDAKGWAQRHLFGVDKDRINVKLTKAIMLTIGDGSTHTFLGDSLRKHLWSTNFQDLQTALIPGTFTCIVTNPPFGQNLKMSTTDARAANINLAKKAVKGSDGKYSYHATKYEERELGILFLERCYELLTFGGRLGIILPETYMFSPSYSWLRQWIIEHFIFRAILNIPMEAFQGFCRAKTNFYILEKRRIENA
ncbi:HsdM family class I SAM-dependent methyltransferase [Chitinophaga ginsengisoli]|uniref:Type I restriction enzyme M protein n=1 Tax=Chitinophaga ginsengisoli TaxID=363837 RepID=A0A2P8G387_9BACT|nr:N-6 DNA methylase [Chitinophaga ginsengisoli]PSL28345.1 type I restriction enzyme M protein [Chitinophaga ginsengisoli]